MPPDLRSARSFSQLQTRVRSMLDTGSTSSFWSVDELKDSLNEAYLSLFDEMATIHSNGDQRIRRFKTFTYPADTESVEFETVLGDGIHTLILLQQRTPGTPPFNEIERIPQAYHANFEARETINLFSAATTSRRLYYDWSGSELRITPRVSTDFTVGCHYIPQPSRLVNDEDVPLLPAQYHDLIVLEAAVAASAKEGAVRQDLQVRRDRHYDRFKVSVGRQNRKRRRSVMHIPDPYYDN